MLCITLYYGIKQKSFLFKFIIEFIFTSHLFKNFDIYVKVLPNLSVKFKIKRLWVVYLKNIKFVKVFIQN